MHYSVGEAESTALMILQKEEQKQLKEKQNQAAKHRLQQRDETRSSSSENKPLNGILPSHLATLADAAASTSTLPFQSSSLFQAAALGGGGPENAPSAGLLAATKTAASDQSQQPQQQLEAENLLLAGRLENLRAAAAAGAAAGAAAASGDFLFQSPFLPPGMAIPPNIPNFANGFPAGFLPSQEHLLAAAAASTPPLIQDPSGMAVPYGLLGGGAFMNPLCNPFGLSAAQGKRLLSPEDILAAYQEQRKPKKQKCSVESSSMASEEESADEKSRSSSSLEEETENGNFPLPLLKRTQQVKKPLLSSFRKDWNNIKTKEMRKEVFLRNLHAAKSTQKTPLIKHQPLRSSTLHAGISGFSV